MDGTVGVLLLIVMLAILGVAGFLANRGMKRLSELLEHVEALQRSVEGAAQSTRSEIGHLKAELPRLYAPVQAGLLRLDEALPAMARSADVLSQTVHTINGDGHLGEWVVGFQTVMEPIQRAAVDLGGQSQAMGQVLHTTGRLFEEWAGQKQAVQRSFEQLSQILDRFTAQEVTHLRDIEHRIMARLEEEAETKHQLVASFSHMETSVNRTADLIGQVQDQTQRTRELLVQVRPVLEVGQRALREQHVILEHFKTWQREFGTGIAEFQAALGRAPTEVSSALEKGLQPVLAHVRAISEAATQSHKAHAAQLQQLGAAQATELAAQNRVLSQQQELLEAASTRMASLPTRQSQFWVIGLMIALNVFTLFSLLTRASH